MSLKLVRVCFCHRFRRSRARVSSRGALKAPLVHTTGKEHSRTFIEQFGDLVSVKATEDGTVSEVTEEHIIVKDSTGKHTYPLHTNYLVGRDSHIHHTPTVQVGSKVKAGDVLATSNFSDSKGHLALGMNLKTAVMPYRSLNFEDAFVISESAAKKLEGEQLIPIRLEIDRGIQTDKAHFISLFANKFYNAQLEHMSDNGVVKKGTVLKQHDPVILAYQPKSLKSLDIQLGKLSKITKNAFSDVSLTWAYEYDGIVQDVSVTSKIITVTVKTRRPMGHGDKLNVPFGAKGVVNIVSDAQMPTGEDGKPIDVLLNTMSLTSRVAPGIVSTMAMGKVAQKTGERVKMTGFVSGSSVEKALKEVEKHGLSATEKLYDPMSGRHIEVFTGPLYMNRLHHIAEDKISTRSAATSYNADMQPSKAGSEEKAKRLGNLATTVALSNDAKAVTGKSLLLPPLPPLARAGIVAGRAKTRVCNISKYSYSFFYYYSSSFSCNRRYSIFCRCRIYI